MTDKNTLLNAQMFNKQSTLDKNDQLEDSKNGITLKTRSLSRAKTPTTKGKKEDFEEKRKRHYRGEFGMGNLLKMKNKIAEE